MPKFRNILPRLACFRQAICEDSCEAEGRTVQLRWIALVFEMTLAREIAGK